ncbi:MAG: FliM/FliN family flagellar motor switch protein [Acidobacteriaceae bacterium]
MSNEPSDEIEGERRGASADDQQVDAPAPHVAGSAGIDIEMESRREVPLPFHFRFGTTTSINKQQLRSIIALTQLFTRGLNLNMRRWLSTSFHINLLSAERIPYSEIVHAPTLDETYVTTLAVGPDALPSLFQLDLDLVYPMVDLLLGGAGNTGIHREPTEIEAAILRSVVELVCRDLSTAWRSTGLEVRHDRSLSSLSMDRLMPVAESTLCLNFEILLEAHRGHLRLIFPAEVSNILIRSVDTPHKTARKQSDEYRRIFFDRVLKIKYPVMLHLPKVKVRVGALSRLAPGDVLELNLYEETASVLSVAKRPLFVAVPVNAGARRGAHVAEQIE